MLNRRSFLISVSAAAVVAGTAKFSVTAAQTDWLPETTEWFATSGLTKEHRHIGDAVNHFVGGLKRDGLWEKFDTLYLPAHIMPTERAALTRLI